MNLRLFIGCAAACLGMALAWNVSASVIPKMRLDQVYSNADMVVQGTVIESTSEWKEYDGNKLLFTYYTVRITSSLKKIAPGRETLKVRTVGGADGTGFHQTLEGEASMSVGEEVVLFLTNEKGWDLPIVEGFYQGKYRVERDKRGNIVSLSRDHGQIPGNQPTFESRIPAGDFLSQMRSLHRGNMELSRSGGGPVTILQPVSNAKSVGGNLFSAANGFFNNDLNGDGSTDTKDLVILLGSWNEAGGASDINGDGIVDGGDLERLLTNLKGRPNNR